MTARRSHPALNTGGTDGLHDPPLEGDGFEPSVPRHNKLCLARPRRASPVAMILCVGNSAQAAKQSWINRQRYAE
jgi:hypothetical protein